MNEKPEAPNKKAGKSRSPLWLVPLILVALALVGTGCGSSDSSSAKKAGGQAASKSKDFEVNPDVSTGAGPQPLKVAFKATTSNAKGDVTYTWKFDEGGAKAAGPNPTYTYKKSGWKLPKVTARDGAGHVAYSGIQIRVWPISLWKKFRSGTVTPEESKRIVIANLKAFERKFHSKVPGISAAPLPGQQPLTPESAKAGREQPGLVRRAERRAARKLKRKSRAARRKARQKQGN